MATRDLTRFGWLSIGTALLTMGLKAAGWAVTGSVGLLSDALESSVNLVAGVLMLLALRVAARPPDDDHQFGHEKVELLSAAAEGLMVVLAASLITWAAVDRLLSPQDVEQVGIGLAVTLVATAVNLVVGLAMVRAGRAHRSQAVTADGRHLLTDVWTSAGVVVAVLLVAITGWRVLDPLVALAVAVNIVVVGFRLLHRSLGALMDPILPEEELQVIREVLDRYEAEGIGFHALRTRGGGHRRFLSLHVLVPGGWSVTQGHALVERLELELGRHLEHLTVFSHLEPIEDPSSYLDEALDRSSHRHV